MCDKIDIGVVIFENVLEGKRMENNKITEKKPMNNEKIFKTLQIITVAVTVLFLVKNLVSKTFMTAGLIGCCAVAFILIIFIMKKANVTKSKQYLVVSILLEFLIFIISLMSGSCSSDDFILYLAAMAVTGLYLNSLYIKIQIPLTDAFLIIQYILQPEKAESLSQYIMLIICLNITAAVFYMVIKRGQQFIESNEERAIEAEKLINSITKISVELDGNFEKTKTRIEELKVANEKFVDSSENLKSGSERIVVSAVEAFETCKEVHNNVEQTKENINVLNNNVGYFQNVLANSHNNINEMSGHIAEVSSATQSTAEVFEKLKNQMNEINEVLVQLKAIAANTNLLSLNASIEAARAGESGAGFAVVASKVQELAVDSNKCSDMVEKIILEMQEQIDITKDKLDVSVEAIKESLNSFAAIEESYEEVNKQFATVYSVIEEQNSKISDMDEIFSELQNKVSGMTNDTEMNQSSVDEMTSAVDVYQNSMLQVANDTDALRDLSLSMKELVLTEN